MLHDARVADVRADEQEILRKLDEARAEAETAGQISLRWHGRGDEVRDVTAGADDLVEYLDGRFIKAVEFEAPRGRINGNRIIIRGDTSAGFYLRVAADDPQWGVAIFTELESQIKPLVPKWRHVKKYWLLWLIYYSAAVTGMYFFADAVAAITTESGTYSSGLQTLFIYAIIIIGGFAAAWATSFTLDRVPAFEILRQGEKASGGRLLNVLWASLGTIVLGILSSVTATNFIT